LAIFYHRGKAGDSRTCGLFISTGKQAQSTGWFQDRERKEHYKLCKVQSGVVGISSVVGQQRLLEWTFFPNRLSTSIPTQQFMGSLGEHSPSLPPLAFDPGDDH
jgi:hypothetical protein